MDDWLRLPVFSIHQARSLVELAEMGIQFVSLEDVAAAIDVPLNRLQPYQSIFVFAYYDRLSPLSPVKVNINRASLEDIAAVPKLTYDLAQKLIANRQSQGKFRNILDLSSRLNLDRDLTSQLIHYIRF